MKSSLPAGMLLVLTAIMLLAVPAMAEEKEETDCLYYFYGEGCLAAGEHLDQLERGIGKSLVMPRIFYYAFLLVIPMVVVIIAVFLIRKNYMQKAEKKEPHKIEAWKRHYLRLQDLVVGGIMLLLGVALIFV